MNHCGNRQHHGRSNSISGHDLYITNGYSRPCRSNDTCNPNSFLDRYQQYGDRPTVQQIYGQKNVKPSVVLNSSGLILNQTSQPPKPPRNHLHASLECLNSQYNDYDNNYRVTNYNQLGHQASQQFHNSQIQNRSIHNQHHAASYVLTAAPADTVVNTSGDQDLAAAAMGNPSHLRSNNYGTPNQNINYHSNNYLAQNLVSRNIINGSPLRKMGAQVASLATNVMPSNPSHYTQSMRAGHSSLYLASSTFLIEDKLQNEIKKLQSELNSEKEKNEALNSQLSINSNLMAAFEQSLTTLNNRLRQLTAAGEKKDKEIEELRDQLCKSSLGSSISTNDQGTSPINDLIHPDDSRSGLSPFKSLDPAFTKVETSVGEKESEKGLSRIIDDLKRQLIEKDRLLTDTRLEALSAAHQLEQLESRLDGENSLLNQEDELDEGVMVINHSPSDSEAVTDSVQYNEINNHKNVSSNETGITDEEERRPNIILDSQSDGKMHHTQHSIVSDESRDLACAPKTLIDDNISHIDQNDDSICDYRADDKIDINPALEDKQPTRFDLLQCSL